MIKKFEQINTYNEIGNKAKNLIIMKKNGFNIPDGFVINTNVFDYILRFNNIEHNITNILNSNDELSIKSENLKNLFDNIIVPDNIKLEINNLIKNKQYAVRSSSLLEDLAGFSFAGQYESYLNICGLDDICKKVIDCYKSMYNENVLNYLVDNNLSILNLKMAVIVQEMVDACKSGVAFSVNPINGLDSEIVIEITNGLGDNLVSGKITPSMYIYDWIKEEIVFNNGDLLSEIDLNTLKNQVLKIQSFFGYPCDIEFSFSKDKLYILQSRIITKINYSAYKEQWTTADFKDGGVSATACKPFMWSLYEYVWENKYKYFLTKTSLANENELTKLSNMFYSRPYWNIGKTKKALSKIPGFKEKEFDAELGIDAIYDGEGIVTNYNIYSVLNAIKFMYKFNNMKKFRIQNNEKLKVNILKKYDYYADKINKVDDNNLEKTWYKLIKKHYLFTEGVYFLQIFINTIAQSMFKTSISKLVTKQEYFVLISNLENISHLLPFYDMWSLSRKIKNNVLAKEFWLNTSTEKILNFYKKNTNVFHLDEFKLYMDKYCYHSDKELDITYKCFIEEPETIIGRLKETIILDDEYGPYLDIKEQRKTYRQLINKLKQRLPKNKFRKLIIQTNEIRKLLWWREEFRDLSSRFYYLLRIYTIKYANLLKQNNILTDSEDIWFLKIFDLINYIDGKLDETELYNIINKNKLYYNSFRNYLSDNEIGIVKNENEFNKSSNTLKGIGCNNGIITGIARVINDLTELNKLQEGDILVTKYTDTGWTNKFAILAGIVTENGGMLCHSAIISREYGIPCIVGVKDAMKHIKDGHTISINGELGEIVIY